MFHPIFRKIQTISSKMICDTTFIKLTVLQLNCATIIRQDLIMEANQDMNFETFLMKKEFSEILIWVSNCREFFAHNDSDDYICRMDGSIEMERLRGDLLAELMCTLIFY